MTRRGYGEGSCDSVSGVRRLPRAAPTLGCRRALRGGLMMTRLLRRLLGGLAGLVLCTGAQGATAAPALQPHDYVVKDFHFRSGETLPELKIHYYTLGTPRKDAAGHVTNAVLILHGT